MLNPVAQVGRISFRFSFLFPRTLNPRFFYSLQSPLPLAKLPSAKRWSHSRKIPKWKEFQTILIKESTAYRASTANLEGESRSSPFLDGREPLDDLDWGEPASEPDSETILKRYPQLTNQFRQTIELITWQLRIEKCDATVLNVDVTSDHLRTHWTLCINVRGCTVGSVA